MELFESKAYECFAFRSPVYVHVNKALGRGTPWFYGRGKWRKIQKG